MTLSRRLAESALTFVLAALPAQVARADNRESQGGARMVAMDEITRPWTTIRPLPMPSAEPELVEPWARAEPPLTLFVELRDPWPAAARPTAMLLVELVDPWAPLRRQRVIW